MVKAALKGQIPTPRAAGGNGFVRKATEQPKGKGKDNGQPKGKSKGTGPQNCASFQDTGKCRWGDQCFNLHADGEEELQRAQATRAARDAARVAQKAQV